MIGTGEEKSQLRKNKILSQNQKKIMFDTSITLIFQENKKMKIETLRKYCS
jgi:hypothetical protein